jgi:NAD(P)-dependent dehydrogenase (short-subunit alcohol dehydrogenase family)
MLMRLRNKVALITGGSSGIGFATAELFRAEGAKVAITGRNQKKLDAAVSALGSNVLAMNADVTNLSEMRKAIVTVVENFGNVDVLFANAGAAHVTPVGRTSMETFEEILKVNITSTFFLVQECLPYLNIDASVIFNGSIQSVNGRPGFSAYAGSKAAIRTMARVLASELSPRGIRVNVVTPGSVKTEIWNDVVSSDEEKARLFKNMEKSIPLGRLATPREVANAVLFLASAESSFIQGGEIVIDGGATNAPLGAPIYR